MRILTCIKQVPGTTSVAIDPDTGSLIRVNIASKMNPYDLFALETALRIREDYGGSITVLTMGPPQAKAVLQEALYMGADDACLLTDGKFAGADVLATSYTLAQGIDQLGSFDLIICGKQTTDGDTAQVGAELAEFMDFPHAANVARIISMTRTDITVEVNLDHVVQIQKIKLPCLIAVDKDVCTPRLPSYKRMKAMSEKSILTLSLKDLADTEENHYGLLGSSTRVEKIYPPVENVNHKPIAGTADEIISELHKLFYDNKYIEFKQ